MTLWKQLPDSLKYGLIIATLILLSASFFGKDRVVQVLDIFIRESTLPGGGDEEIKVPIYVSSAENEPIPDAHVRFLINGNYARTETNNDGYASVSIPKSSGDEIEVDISKEGFRTIKTTINLNISPGESRRMKLYPNIPIEKSVPPEEGEGNRRSTNDPGSRASNGATEAPDPKVNPSAPSGENGGSALQEEMSPVEFVALYFYRVDHGLYREAFQMLSQAYLQNVYPRFSLEGAFNNYKEFWDRCDYHNSEENYLDYGDFSQESFNEDEAIISYQASLFCKDDHEVVGRKHELKTRKMILLKSPENNSWKIKSAK